VSDQGQGTVVAGTLIVVGLLLLVVLGVLALAFLLDPVP
jgi:hypothetical protein